MLRIEIEAVCEPEEEETEEEIGEGIRRELLSKGIIVESININED